MKLLNFDSFAGAVTLAVVSAVAGTGARAETILTSPDGRNQIVLRTSPLSYEVRRDGVSLIANSRIGMTIDGVALSAGEKTPEVIERTVSGAEPSPIYKKSRLDLSGKEAFVSFGDWGVRLAARNDGVAYRFETMREGTIRVDSEIGEVVVADRDSDCTVHLSKRCGCEENPASFLKARDLVPPDGSPACLPVFLAAGGKALVMTEADVCDYPVAYLSRDKRDDGALSFSSVFAAYPAETYHAGKGNWNPQVPSKERGRWEIVKSSEPYLVKTEGRRTFPWRAFLLADRPADLMSSDLVRALARPAEKGLDFSWVKPGKVTWEWWNAWDNVGDPIKGGADGCTTETYRRFFDLAAEHGVEYVIFDEGWSQTLDIWNLNENVDLKSLIAYGNERGVGTILWMAWDQVVGDEERVAREFAKMGVKGFKVDFMNRGDAACEKFYWTFARACAENRLVVDFHGAHRPTGLSRTYPNVLNYEGVHGLEQMKFYRGQDILANDVAICFTRMSAGPMDYTPGAMDNYPVGKYPSSKVKDMFTNPGSLGTRSRQMAMMVLYEAPLQMLCDSVKKYRANSECFRFMAGTPVVWDDTVGLGGSPETYAAVARRAKDGAWYAAAIGNGKPHDVAVDTGFLGEGPWSVEAFQDADDSDASPMHYVHTSGKSVRAGERLTFRLAPGGGFVLKFTRREAACASRLDAALPGIFARAAAQTRLLLAEADGLPEGRLPRSENADGTLRATKGVRDWTSGFFPGVLWNLYAATGDEGWRTAARRWTEKLEPVRTCRTTHDVGFVLMCSYGNALKYDAEAPASWRSVLCDGAESLATRYDPRLRTLRSWDNPRFRFPVIIDNLMNLELLTWAARHGGAVRLDEIARTHAETTRLNQFRPDGSVYHVTDYNPADGTIFARYAWQGASVEGAAWSRGQGWGVYGFAMMFRETGDARFLAAARRIADFVLAHPNLPPDGVPCWDLRYRPGEGEPRDASAAAVLAAGLIELASFVPASDGARYLAQAEKSLLALASDAYTCAPGAHHGFILCHSTGHKPESSEVDVPIAYADYYYLEALLRFRARSAGMFQTLQSQHIK